MMNCGHHHCSGHHCCHCCHQDQEAARMEAFRVGFQRGMHAAYAETYAEALLRLPLFARQEAIENKLAYLEAVKDNPYRFVPPRRLHCGCIDNCICR